MGQNKDLGIQHGGALSQGERLGLAADDIQSAKGLLEQGDGGFPGFGGLLELPSALMHFGEYGAAPAFNDFSDAWIAECKTLEGAVRELQKKIGVSSKAYRGTDLARKSDFSAIDRYSQNS
ncbi:hypothetical protein [Streptomyces sp. ME19-01-6]|uniref:hypothetical protein n=1 Tax=Streptomyces sp. ME19-01-6 TaxID=3028686 RepID=UPI0029B19247|nr:hypothetical protein [Streptomyces sp. ME19-01-6]MDX3230811.1 hypothetical protein [Streptomyces sp. ME19-01-6]